MDRPYQITSITIIVLTLIWLLFYGFDSHTPQWQYLTAAAVHFLMAIIINRQFTPKSVNYYGLTHSILMIVLGVYGYFIA